MLRTEAIAVLAELRDSMLSVVTMQPNSAWVACGQADVRNINLLGSMGSASTLGAGLALAKPAERVLVIDGDGSLLMQLGSLVTIGGLQLTNFFHVVFENGVYETSGAQPLPGAGLNDLCGHARAAGYRQVVRHDTVEQLRSELPAVLAQDGPAFVSVVISGQGQIPPHDLPAPPPFPEQMEAMRVALGASS